MLESNNIPATFILSKDGSIVIDKVGAADWNSQKVREQLDQTSFSISAINKMLLNSIVKAYTPNLTE